MKRIILLTLALGVALLFNVYAQDLTAKQIVVKSEQATQAKSTVNKVQMTLINKRDEKRVIKMVSRAKTAGGLSRTVSTFLYPDEVKGTKFLLVENADREADMMIFIPDLGRVRKISSSQRNQSYMGSDFAYGDLEALDPDGDHALIGTEDFEGAECYVVQTILDPREGAGYSKMTNWFRRDNFVAVKTEYYDKDGNLKKVKTVHDLRRQNDIWVLTKIVMKDVQRKHQTIIEILESNQQEVDDSFFTVRFLQQTDRY